MTVEIMREVKPSGNSAHVVVPRAWLGDEVIIKRRERRPVKERILSLIKPYMAEIEGVYLFGSHARSDARQDSDIDLLVLTTAPLSITKTGFDIITLTEDAIHSAFSITPLLIYSALQEAQPVINAALLESIRRSYPFNPANFKGYLATTGKVIDAIADLLSGLSESDSIPGDLAYSLILRLRGVFLIKQHLRRKQYSHSGFFSWLHKGYPNLDPEQLYNAYLLVKRNRQPQALNVRELRLALTILGTATSYVSQQIHGKEKTASRKGNSVITAGH